jgi:hypothetical protein
VSVNILSGTNTVVSKVNITDLDLIEDFLNRNQVGDPEMYIRHLAHSAKLWLPVFYYIRQAGLTESDAIDVIQTEKGVSQKHVQALVARVRDRLKPTGSPTASSAEPQRAQLIEKTIARPENRATCQLFLKAVRTLTSAEVDADFLFPLLKHCFENFDNPKLREALRYTLAHVDVIWHSEVIDSMLVGATQAQQTV